MKKIVNIAATVLMVFSVFSLSAQGGSSPPPPAVSGPIDSGAIVLVLLVACYGYFKIKQKGQATT